MSKALKCDWCGTYAEVVDGDVSETDDWVEVRWPGRGRRTGGIAGDYCTAACAVQAIEQARDDDAETLLALQDEDDQ